MHFLISGVYTLRKQILLRGKECFLFLILNFSQANNLKYPDGSDENLWEASFFDIFFIPTEITEHRLLI